MPENILTVVKVKKTTMKEPSINSKVFQSLHEFETMENITTSKEWNDSLMVRLSYAKHHPASRFPSAKFVIVAVMVLLINIGFFVNSMINNSQQDSCRNNTLQLISKELLINPTSLNK